MKKKIQELTDLEKMLFAKFYYRFRIREERLIDQAIKYSLEEIELLRKEME